MGPDITTDAPRIAKVYGLDGPVLDNKSWTSVGIRRYMRLTDEGEYLTIHFAGWVLTTEAHIGEGFDTLGAAKQAAAQ